MSTYRYFKKLRRVFFRWISPLLKKWYAWNSSRKTRFHYRGVSITVFPGVFHPRFTISTKYFIDFLLSYDLNQKKLLELGCGSALISLHSAKQGAVVTASDINPAALEGLEFNTIETGLKVRGVSSDLFQNIPAQSFDYIIINPPYYPKKAENVEQAAWYCGEDFEYFQRLFQQLPDHIHSRTEVLMVLSEDCALDKIREIAARNQFQLEKRHEKVINGEENYIFLIRKN